MEIYINAKIEEFNNKCENIENKLYRYDGDYKKRWNKDREQIRAYFWNEIMSANDVYRYVDSYVFAVENEKSLNVTDLCTYDVDLSLYRAIFSLQKMAKCYNNNRCDFNSLGKTEIDEIFYKLQKAYMAMKEERLYRTSLN